MVAPFHVAVNRKSTGEYLDPSLPEYKRRQKCLRHDSFASCDKTALRMKV